MSRLPRHAGESPLPPPAGAPADSRYRCPLCGYRFAVGREVCSTCGFSGGCEAVGCPHCGYQFPLESSTVAWVRRIWNRLRGKEVA